MTEAFSAPTVAVLGAIATFFSCWLLLSPYRRLVAFVGGSLFVLQADSGPLASLKPVLLIFLLVAGGISAVNLRRLPIELRAALRPIKAGCALLSAMIIIYIAYSVFIGADFDRVVRDATTYVMIVVGPLIGADASRASSLVKARLTVAVSCAVGAASFAVFWIAARGVGSLGLDRLGMFTYVLTAFGFVSGIVYGAMRRRWLWLLVGLFCLLAVLVTGTRTGALMALGLLAVLFFRDRGKAMWPSVLVSLGATVIAVGVLLPLFGGAVVSDGFLESRGSAFASLLTDGISADASGVIRERALEITGSLWSSRPLMGVGFGYAFPSADLVHDVVDFQLDSGLLVFAKFGLLGAAVLITVLLLFVTCVARFHKAFGVVMPAQRVGVGLFCIFAGLMFLAWPMEDKGFALSLGLLVFLLSVEGRYSLIDGRVGESVIADVGIQ